MKIHQGTYNVAKLMEMEVKNAKKTESPGFIPTESSKRSVFTKTQTQATEKEIRLFQKKVGVHMWGLQTDPSAMFVVHRLASAMLNTHAEGRLDRDEQVRKVQEYLPVNGCGV